MQRQQLIAFFFFFFFLSSPILHAQTDDPILVVDISGTIDQSTVELIDEAFKEASYIGAQAIILRLDTPGGGVQETFDIEECIYQSSIPVIGYVAPSGAVAWSAGTFLLLSTPLAAMAQDTIIGSCQPVQVTTTGSQPINDSKTINALVEWLTVRTDRYQRNSTLAEEFITRNTNVDEEEALAAGVIEYAAEDIENLIEQLDNVTVPLSDTNVTIYTSGVEIKYHTPSSRLRFYQFISDPLISSILLLIGFLVLFIGLSTPGFGAEVFGGIALLLALIGMGFSISTLAIIFITIGALLLIVELFITPGFGVIGIGGLICLAIGMLFLVPTYPNRGWLISMEYINDLLIILFFVIVFAAIFFGFLLYKILEIRSKRPVLGLIKGEIAITVDPLIPGQTGYVRWKDALWNAKSDSRIESGEKVEIIEKDGFVLLVKPFQSSTKD